MRKKSHPEGEKRAIAICGPTASGKSTLADSVAERMGVRATVVDSMQVYREIPIITNQNRRRQANLVGVVSVDEEWNVARHREAVRALEDEAMVFDAGTGMYLNATLLEIELWPRVDEGTRERARMLARGRENERRQTRRIELSLAGERPSGSIWGGDLRYETTMVYLRPERHVLDRRIARRSRRIAEEGIEEAELVARMIEEGRAVSEQVMGSIGVRELLGVVRGEISRHEAEDAIARRTSRMARRQMRWFDKLARTIYDRAEVVVFTDAVSDPEEIVVPS